LIKRDGFTLANFHFNASVISRSAGKSIIACAAYRSAEKLHDERLGQSFDYTGKGDVFHTEILLPEKAPVWMKERDKLWNTVELHEKRRDSQLAREVQFSLPRELTISQNIELTRDFINQEFVKNGMVADIAIHNPHASDGEMQPHAHVLLTMREITENGFGKKVRTWNEKSVLENWRTQCSEYMNKHLALNGHDLRVDHRSFKERGIDLEPQKKIGVASAFYRSDSIREHEEIAQRNGERLLKNPEIIFDILTKQQSTFTHHDIARLVNRYTATLDQFNHVYEKLKSSEDLVYLGVDDRNRERFTTCDMLKIESEMVKNANTLHQTNGHEVKIDTSIFSEKHRLSPEQAKVLDFITDSGDLKNVIGFAGTGKSRLLGAAKEVWESAGYSVKGATLSGIAAENLEASSGINSRTLASRFY
jgi:Ti-type conjugative transfer relaxase TraA